MARSTARATSRMSVALGQAPLASESLLLGPPPLAEAAQLLGWPTQSERIRVALGPADEPLPTQTEGVAHHGRTAGTHQLYQPASPCPTSASPRGHCGTADSDRMLTSSAAFGGSYTSPLSVLGGPAVSRVGLFR